MSRDMRPRHAELEGQLMLARMLARRLWATLTVRVDAVTADMVLNGLPVDMMRIVDPLIDAAEIVWERHRVMVEPCRRILGATMPGARRVTNSLHSGPDQAERYIAHYPGGDTREIDRAQLLMMAGFDPEDAAQG